MQKLLSYFLAVIVIAGCKQSVSLEDQTFPALTSLDSIRSTEFVPTLEHKINEHKNAIYSPAFLYAWDELRKKIGGDIKVPENSDDLQLINQSLSYKDALLQNEYTQTVQIQNSKISVSSAFEKNLPFKDKMNTSKKAFIFNGVSVQSFGMTDFDEKIADQINILYYESDDKFIFEIVPKDDTQQIVLVKGLNDKSNFDETLNEVKRYADIGQKERDDEKTQWKYYLLHGDQVLLPVMKFNYKTQYKNIIGQSIVARGTNFWIISASQTNAFLIDENGAKVESEGMVTAAAAAAPAPPHGIIIHKKKLFLNKDFVLILRKQKAQYPYFMMTVVNADIMIKR